MTDSETRMYVVYDGRALAYNDTDRASILEIVGEHSRPPWKACRLWKNHDACLYSYAINGPELTDERFEGVIR